MACFHSNAAATGTIRNGVIIKVRTIPRPKKLRFNSNEMPSPSARETITTVTVSTMVNHTLDRRAASVKTVT
jgi:hypothetical protein